MQVIDPLPPFAHRAYRFAATEQKMPGVEAESDRSQLEHLFDLPGRLDVGAGLVVEGRLVSTLAAAPRGHLHALGESPPRLVVEAQGTVRRGLTGAGSTPVAADVGEGGFWLHAVFRTGRVEDIEQRAELAQRCGHPGVIREGQFEEAARQCSSRRARLDARSSPYPK